MKRPQIEFSERGNCSGSCGESESEETACEFMSASRRDEETRAKRNFEAKGACQL